MKRKFILGTAAGLLMLSGLLSSCGQAGRKVPSTAEEAADRYETEGKSEFSLNLKIPMPGWWKNNSSDPKTEPSPDTVAPPLPPAQEWTEQPFTPARANPVSTFALESDKASYTLMRSAVEAGSLPPAESVRIEEYLNYFSYPGYPRPTGEMPYAIHTETAPCPWNDGCKLLLVGLRTKDVPKENLPPARLIFLVDVSGSMDMPGKMPLLKSSLKLMTEQLRPQDQVAVVTYSGDVRVALPPTPGSDKRTIMRAIEALHCGGGTAGGAGLELAYQTAQACFIEGGNNRVLLATDGDFNVGVSSDEELVKMIEQKRKTGIYLSILGFGTGNYQDVKMEKISSAGNGFYAYIDSEAEAVKTMAREVAGSLYTVATDAKIQTVFNSEYVESYRLIGYDNRRLQKEDFDNDAKDAGELGAGHYATALYEIKFRKSAVNREYGRVKFRYKPSADAGSLLTEFGVTDRNLTLSQTTADFKFASSVAALGLSLRNSKYKGTASAELAVRLADYAGSDDPEKESYRKLLAKIRKLAL